MVVMVEQTFWEAVVERHLLRAAKMVELILVLVALVPEMVILRQHTEVVGDKLAVH
jgi:hypothetical protein